MPQWTEDQQKVIGSTSEKLVCSAAAGSGKTAVMIERIARLIRDGADPFSFLVITFTNAAAAEMKEKIRIRLTKERKNALIAAAAEGYLMGRMNIPLRVLAGVGAFLLIDSGLWTDLGGLAILAIIILAQKFVFNKKDKPQAQPA